MDYHFLQIMEDSKPGIVWAGFCNTMGCFLPGDGRKKRIYRNLGIKRNSIIKKSLNKFQIFN